MLIKSIQIENFRCFEKESISLEVLTAILGRNGSGKSTILSAIEVFYDVSATISEDDFYGKLTDREIRIQVVYGDLRPPEKAEFKAYLRDSLLGVTKVIRLNNGRADQKYYGSMQQIPILAEIRASGKKTDQVNKWNEAIDAGKLPDAEKLSLRGADLEAAMEKFEDDHPDLMAWVDQEAQFFGPKNVGGGKLDKYTKFVRIPAVRNVTDDMAEKKGSPLFQLLDMLVLRRVNARADVRSLKAEFAERIQQTFNPENLTELEDLSNEITNTLQWFVPNSKLNLRWLDIRPPEIPNPSYSTELEEDEFSGAIDRKGHGLQRALIFSMLQHLAVAKPVEIKEDAEEGAPQGALPVPPEPQNDQDLEGDALPDLILAIDEPELYQHPLRAKHLCEVFQKMSQDTAYSLGARNQILYTTHSPYFVDLRNFHQVRIVQKCKPEKSAPYSKIFSYDLHQASQEMARATGKDPVHFTADSFYVRAYPIMTLAVNEGFFADAVVLVEGLTEVAALNTVAEILGASWLAKGIAVISVEGKNKIDRAAIIFKGLGIPTYLIFDGDIRHKENAEKAAKEKITNRILLTVAGAKPEDFPDDGAYQYHACFADEFETYVKNHIGSNKYNMYRAVIADKHNFDKPGDILKNFEACVDFIRLIYNNKLDLPLLEEMVVKINELLGK